jgi:hypothetical protein
MALKRRVGLAGFWPDFGLDFFAFYKIGTRQGRCCRLMGMFEAAQTSEDHCGSTPDRRPA